MSALRLLPIILADRQLQDDRRVPGVVLVAIAFHLAVFAVIEQVHRLEIADLV